MTNQTCASKGCRRPPVPGSKHCEFHLAKSTRRTRDIAGIVAVILAVVVGMAKIIGGRKS